MPDVNLTRVIVQPDAFEHDTRCPRSLCSTPQKVTLFALITNPDAINDALVISRRTGNSPITVYEPIIKEATENNQITSLSNHEKQFVGTVICTVMEMNGFKKTGRKQSFSNGLFKKAEIYVPID